MPKVAITLTRLLPCAVAVAALTLGSGSASAQLIATPSYSFPTVTPGGVPPTPLQVGVNYKPYWFVGPNGTFRVAPSPTRGEGSWGSFIWGEVLMRERMCFQYRTSTVLVYSLHNFPDTYFAFSTCPPFKILVSNGGIGWQCYQEASTPRLSSPSDYP